jgi:ATP-dependent RNA helicase DeaD
MSFPPSHPALDRALAARGYEEPTPVQRAVLETETPDADLLVSAQTGSGKTVAFGLAMAPTLLGDAERFGSAGPPLALIIAPTRELALQIIRELDWLYAGTGARIAQAVGGMDARREQRALEAGAHILVGTPGRLRDHLERGYLNLADLKVAVLDEADEMLDLGFREELEFILDATPPARRTLLFSATIARDIAMLARNYQRDAVRIDTTSHTQPHGDIEYRAIRVAPADIDRAVVNVLRYFEAASALVFCHTREGVRTLHATLRDKGFAAVGLSGEMSQRERTDALQALRDRRARVCVATDVAARGLDLPELGLVVHADLPSNKATLLHRSGRTGRAGRKGVSVLMVTASKRRKCEQILNSANIDAIWQGPPSAADIRALDRERLLDSQALSAQASDEDRAVATLLAERLPPEQIAAVLARLLRADLPQPEDISDDPRAREPRQPRERADHRDVEAPPRTPPQRLAPDDVQWFSLNVGRARKADPKWLVPLICRLGQVTKAEIGAIRIFETETRFEIRNAAAEGFAASAAATIEDDTRITPATAPDASMRPVRAQKPQGERPPRDGRKRWTPDGEPLTRHASVEPSPRPRRRDHDRDMAALAEATPSFTPRPESHHEPRADRPAKAHRAKAWPAAAAPDPDVGDGQKPQFQKRPRQRVRARDEKLAAQTPSRTAGDDAPRRYDPAMSRSDVERMAEGRFKPKKRPFNAPGKKPHRKGGKPGGWKPR